SPCWRAIWILWRVTGPSTASMANHLSVSKANVRLTASSPDASPTQRRQATRVTSTHGWRLFMNPPRGQSRVGSRAMLSLPGLTLLEEARGPERYSARFRLEPESSFLDGHFPGHPILPAIAQVGLAVRGAYELLGSNPALASLSGVRFRRTVHPGETI